MACNQLSDHSSTPWIPRKARAIIHFEQATNCNADHISCLTWDRTWRIIPSGKDSTATASPSKRFYVLPQNDEQIPGEFYFLSLLLSSELIVCCMTVPEIHFLLLKSFKNRSDRMFSRFSSGPYYLAFSAVTTEHFYLTIHSISWWWWWGRLAWMNGSSFH